MEGTQQSSRVWNCPTCQEELGELNAYCMFCYHANNIKIYNPEPYFIRTNREYHMETMMSDAEIDNMSEEEFESFIDSNERLTPAEKLYSKLFRHETKLVVKDMERLVLRAHIEELSKIAFEARVRHTAAKAEDDRRGKISKDGKPTGFERSLNTDDTTTNAINTIKERQGRQSKAEKVRANMLAMYEMAGHTKSEAEEMVNKLMSAGTLLIQTKKAAAEAIEKAAEIEKNKPAPKPIVNPFEKKS